MTGKKNRKTKRNLKNKGFERTENDFEFFEHKQQPQQSKSKRTIRGALRETAVGGRKSSQSTGWYLGCLACCEPG